MPLSEFKKLERLLEDYPEAVGIGEIGIDHTTRCKCSASHNKERCLEEKIETSVNFASRVTASKKTRQGDRTPCPQQS